MNFTHACELNSQLACHMFDELPERDVFVFLIRVWEIDES